MYDRSLAKSLGVWATIALSDPAIEKQTKACQHPPSHCKSLMEPTKVKGNKRHKGEKAHFTWHILDFPFAKAQHLLHVQKLMTCPIAMEARRNGLVHVGVTPSILNYHGYSKDVYQPFTSGASYWAVQRKKYRNTAPHSL